MMNEVWYCNEDGEFFDSEETARLGYIMWCKANKEEFDEKIFREAYSPLSEAMNIWTKNTICDYEP